MTAPRTVFLAHLVPFSFLNQEIPCEALTSDVIVKEKMESIWDDFLYIRSRRLLVFSVVSIRVWTMFHSTLFLHRGERVQTFTNGRLKHFCFFCVLQKEAWALPLRRCGRTSHEMISLSSSSPRVFLYVSLLIFFSSSLLRPFVSALLFFA